MGKKYLLEIEENKDGNFAWSNFAPYTEPDLEQVRKEAYDKGYETAKHECEDCNTNIVVEAIRKEAYEKAYEQGRKDGKIEGQAETWVCVKKIAFKPEIAECVDDLVRIGFDVGTADSWSEAIELLFEKYSASEAIEKIRQYEQEKEEQDGLRQNIQTIVDQCGYTLDEIASVLQKMRES